MTSWNVVDVYQRLPISQTTRFVARKSVILIFRAAIIPDVTLVLWSTWDINAEAYYLLCDRRRRTFLLCCNAKVHCMSGTQSNICNHMKFVWTCSLYCNTHLYRRRFAGHRKNCHDNQYQRKGLHAWAEGAGGRRGHHERLQHHHCLSLEIQEVCL